MHQRATVGTIFLILAFPSICAAGLRHGCGGDARASLQAQVDGACPCATASSRPAYLRCVNDQLRDLSGCRKGPDGKPICRPISRACATAVRRTASQSTCGEPDTVTCCIPRQHECVGDLKPADGKKEGRCSATSRPCDGLADCLITRCRAASSAARCLQVGGTVGAGKDCNSACAP